jgi:hypothetical protein
MKDRKEYLREYGKKHRDENPLLTRARVKAWLRAHPEKVKKYLSVFEDPSYVAKCLARKRARDLETVRVASESGNHCQRWTVSELFFLEAHIGYPARWLSRKLCRSYNAVHGMKQRIKQGKVKERAI